MAIFGNFQCLTGVTRKWGVEKLEKWGDVIYEWSPSYSILKYQILIFEKGFTIVFNSNQLQSSNKFYTLFCNLLINFLTTCRVWLKTHKAVEVGLPHLTKPYII